MNLKAVLEGILFIVGDEGTTIKVIVTAEDGTTKKEVTINITKHDPSEDPDDCTLRRISIEGYDLKFESSTMGYNITIPKPLGNHKPKIYSRYTKKEK